MSERLLLRILLPVALVICVQTSSGLDPNKAITQYQQDFWTEEDGLPQASVQTITQTKNGYLWIGTRDGLARFDGTKFTVFRGEDHPGLPSDDIRSLFEDSKGRLWVGTFNGGVSCFENDSFRSHSTRDGLTSGVLEIYEDAERNVWFGSWNGIIKFTNDKFQSFTEASGLEGRNGWAIWEDANRKLWAATDRSLHVFENGRFAKTNFAGSRPRDIRTVLMDRDAVTWIGTLNGLIRVEGGEATRLRTRDGLPDSRIRALAEDDDRNLWVGTWSGLSRIRATNIANFPAVSGERFNGMVEALFVDRDGSLWVGVRGGGLGRLRDARFANLTIREGLPSNHPRSVFQARDGAMWIATDGGGLARLKDGVVVTISREQGLPSDFVVSVAEDRDGTIWAGLGRPAAIASIKQGKIQTVIGSKEGLPFDYSVRALLVDNSGILWAGGDGGLIRYCDGKFQKVEGVRGGPVRTIKQDRAGALWVAAGEALCRMENDKLTASFTVRDGLSHNAVYSIHEDDAGVLWLGTQQGLTRYYNGQFQALTRSKGGFNGTIYFITEDCCGLIWMSSSRGISAINKKELEETLDGRRPMVEMVNYGVADGLKTSQAQGGSQSPGCKTSDGRLWFATLNGIAIISPREKHRDTGPPPVLLEELWANRKLYRLRDANDFSPNTDDFEFHYTALKFITPERTQFRYQLIGHDKDWVHANNRRVAYYSNLRPGEFTFRVAASHDGVTWSEPVESASFRLRPHFYQTIPFYLACVGLLAVGAWVFHKRRLMQAEEKFALVLAERTRIARDLHDTLAQGFAGTAFQLEALRSNLVSASPQTKSHLDLALTMVRHSFTEARRAVMNLRSPMLEKGDLVAAVRQMGEQMVADTPVQLTVRTSGKDLPFEADVENEILRICQEAIANVLKHAQATRIEVIFDFSADGPTITISDNGVGFDVRAGAAVNGHHFGIQGMNERMKQIGGTLQIKSAAGAGTRVVIQLP